MDLIGELPDPFLRLRLNTSRKPRQNVVDGTLQLFYSILDCLSYDEGIENFFLRQRSW